VTGPREAAARRAELVAQVRGRLEAEGVRVVLNAAGDGVRLEAAAPPSAELVRLARTHRAALLEALTAEAPAKAEDIPPADSYSELSKSPDAGAGRSSFAGQPDRAAQVAALALTPGHCGACGRWEALPEPLAHLGTCNAGRRAHGWQDGNPAAGVEIHAAHRCAAWEGQGFRAKASGQRRGPPAEPAASGVAL